MDTAMAKAKKKGVKGVKGEKEQRVRSIVTAIRSRPEWREWVERLAEFDRVASLNELFDRALMVYAREVGFKEAPPKR